MTSDINEMTPNRPYLLRGLYDWILDNDLTPYILVDATLPDSSFPSDYIDDGKITLNVSPLAVKSLQISNESVSFNARFSGRSYEIFFPINAVLAIYSRENGRGMIFPDEEDRESNTQPSDKDINSIKQSETSAKTAEKKKPHLKLVK